MERIGGGAKTETQLNAIDGFILVDSTNRII